MRECKAREGHKECQLANKIRYSSSLPPSPSSPPLLLSSSPPLLLSSSPLLLSLPSPPLLSSPHRRCSKQSFWQDYFSDDDVVSIAAGLGRFENVILALEDFLGGWLGGGGGGGGGGEGAWGEGGRGKGEG